MGSNPEWPRTAPCLRSEAPPQPFHPRDGRTPNHGILVAVIATAITPAPAQPAPAYWEHINGCGHGHRRTVAELGLTRLLRNHVPVTARRRVHATHLRRCVLRRRDRRAVAHHWRQLRSVADVVCAPLADHLQQVAVL